MNKSYFSDRVYELQGEVNKVALRSAHIDQECAFMIMEIEKIELTMALIEAELAVLSAAVIRRSP